MSIQLKRAYEAASKSDGYRVLVDRLWPRGLSRQSAKIDCWLKEIAPSTALRKWFNHDPEKWNEFKKRYNKELDSHPDVIEQITKMVQDRRVTFVFGARDETFNDAVALKEYLAKHGVN